jgi:hypothetical protein
LEEGDVKAGQKSIHMSNLTYEDDIKIKSKHVAHISRTFYQSIETLSRPPQSHETSPLIVSHSTGMFYPGFQIQTLFHTRSGSQILQKKRDEK